MTVNARYRITATGVTFRVPGPATGVHVDRFADPSKRQAALQALRRNGPGVWHIEGGSMGGFLPSDVHPDDVRHLLSVGLIESVDAAGSRSTQPG